MIAPASLKQGCPLKCRFCHYTPLRGMIAPASLKQVSGGGLDALAKNPLRGMIAPASLKRDVILGEDSHVVDHSGA